MRDHAAESAALRDADPMTSATQADVDGWLAFTQTDAFKTTVCVCGPFRGQRDKDVPLCGKHPLYTRCLCDVGFWKCRFHAPGTVTDGPHCIPVATWPVIK